MNITQRTFGGPQPFEAYRKCVEWLEGLGCSVGSMERHNPVGVRFERGARISKFSGLGPHASHIHGWIEGDMRVGPVTFSITNAGYKALHEQRKVA